ncbi:GTPase activating protein 1-like [Gouania willdenowi]|uniref:GTPase activating protein 1-like n=1 Tax=Gouania willdenowi TaxID=441366 RepID=A0A8C5ESX5_GOUWI|nr:GTPase activating protein 1-like [Gouania willdenowi]XP_028314020.1 GTPase activating protein 1-like [Gouania willdenowi]XP_028314213.1 GTPase activating protein 1-like [Gouania willdenowi]XP_028314214.1 GTPase activating protein 1-like [Gouania willdenowi]
MASCLHLLLFLCGAPVALSQLRLFNLRASDLPDRLLGTTDGYVEVFLGSSPLGKTSVRYNNPNPWWEEEFTFFKAQENNVLRLEVYDSDVLFDDLLGTCQRTLRVGTHMHDCYLKKGGTLHYTYTLTPQQ